MTHATDSTQGPARPTLVMAMDLGRGQWRLGFAIGAGQRPRNRTIRGEEWRRLADEIAAAKAKFGLPAETRVVSCYEAGPDEGLAPRSRRQLADSRVNADFRPLRQEDFDRAVLRLAPEAEADEVPFFGSRYRTLDLIHLQAQPPFDEPNHTGHHPVPRAFASDVMFASSA